MSLPLTATFAWPLQFCAFTSVITYVVSLVTGNVSQVDRLWTFLPTIYTAYFALLPLWPVSRQPFPLCPYVPEELRFAAKEFSPRATLMLGLIFTWMCRLSYNTYRRGLFSLKDEDYRWAVLRKTLPSVLFQIFNISFISIIQNVLLMMLSYPTYIAVAEQPHTALVLSDIALALTSLIILGLEFTADNQQYAYHSFKHSFLGTAEPYDEMKQWPGARLAWSVEDAKRGFVTKGLWAYSRHPNFACEQSFWWIMTFMPLMLRPSLPHYTIHDIMAFVQARDTISAQQVFGFCAQFKDLLPAISLSALFYSSTLFTEGITRSKYPDAYALYRSRVGMFSWFQTVQKALLLRVQGRLAEVEQAIWGSGKGKEKEKET
ncbi:hypothetical protein C8J56DRAFT_815284 [Mycena floridula]|nr:hypothetical protein C8J56DRAFT_815284 [Mycena floridula]